MKENWQKLLVYKLLIVNKTVYVWTFTYKTKSSAFTDPSLEFLLIYLARMQFLC